MMDVGGVGELRKFLAPEFLFGRGALDLAGRYAANLGARKVLVVTDPGVLAAGWTARILETLDAAGLRHLVYADVSQNPRVGEVMAGAAAYHAGDCDAILAVGGGSPMDCGKGIGLVVSNDRHIAEFEGADQVALPMPPTICVPTTGGTGADVSQFAIVSDPAERRKLAIISKAVVPDVSLVDPRTLTTMDAYLTACTGMDALVHAIEALVSTGHGPLTDLHALEAIRLVTRHLEASIASPADLCERESMMLASLQAGLAFSNASLGLVHAMAHSLGGFLDLPHGECNAILLEHVVDFNFEAASARYALVARAMGVEVDGVPADEIKPRLLERIRALRLAVGIDRSLSQAGIGRGDLALLGANAMADACMVTNPRTGTQQDLERLYEQAL